MSEQPSNRPDLSLSESLKRLEQRLDRLEQHLQLPPIEGFSPAAETPAKTSVAVTASPAAGESAEEELEFVVGQNWFAGVGVLVLACGVGFALSLPLSGLPPAIPSLAGYALATGLLLVARFWQKSFNLIANWFRGAGMGLLFFSTLRLFFFGQTPVLEADSIGGSLILLTVVGVNLAVAFRQKSPWLVGTALLTGLVAVLAMGAPFLVWTGVVLLSGVAALAAVRCDWPGLLLFAIPASYATHLLWVINRPWSGRPLKVMAEPAAGILFVLAYAVILAAGSLWRRKRTQEEVFTLVAVLLNCGFSFLIFLLQSAELKPTLFAPAHLLAALVYMGLAVAFWRSAAGRGSTFFYAIAGYMALSVAIVKSFYPSPDVFIWLSGQSLVVVVTALWFRSRLIVVANFFIYVFTVLAYMVFSRQETGISIGFGVVALLTARILKWKMERLELKTELMRNAYLASAFIIFPYALYHLVPRSYVSLSWVTVAVAYYLMNLVVQSPKYRWMGHLTLLLTVAYVLIIGLTQLSSAYRIVSFLVLGTVLLAVSLIFTRVRARRKRAAAVQPSAPDRAP